MAGYEQGEMVVDALMITEVDGQPVARGKVDSRLPLRLFEGRQFMPVFDYRSPWFGRLRLLARYQASTRCQVAVN
jgi:hypothetical protein